MYQKKRKGSFIALEINEKRLLNNLEEISAIGYSDKGINRMALSEEDLEGRDWLQKKMKEMDMEVSLDSVANMIGLYRMDSKYTQSVIIGSHLDSVPNGGKYDGTVGIVAGLECIQTLREIDMKLPWNLELINFCDEEGFHCAGTFGSRAMIGLMEEHELDHRKKEGLPTLAEDIKKLGINPYTINQIHRDTKEIRAYLELHIEQGNILEESGVNIGIVTGIVHIYRYIVKNYGTPNHAGTTPMEKRNDALVKVAPLLTLIPQWALQDSPTGSLRATVGQIKVEPGSFNVIPGLCEFSIEIRSLDHHEIQRLSERIGNWLEENTTVYVFETILEKDGALISESMIRLIEKAAIRYGTDYMLLPSGAGHDAMGFAKLLPTGLIFIPSRNGLSHSPDEYCEARWIIDGANVLLNTLYEMALYDHNGNQ